MNEPTQTPRDGETLGVFEFHAYFDAWVHMSGYADMGACLRRCESLTRAYGVPFRQMLAPGPEGGYYPRVGAEHTAALRAALAPAPSVPPICLDDAAAHVAETVEELRQHAQWETWRKRGSYEWLRQSQQEGAAETVDELRETGRE